MALIFGPIGISAVSVDDPQSFSPKLGEVLYKIWVNYNDLTVRPSPGIMVLVRGIIPFYGPTIQVSEIL